MGAEPWSYFAPFEPSAQSALDKLRRKVFESGAYRGSDLKPATIDEVMSNMSESGTASILDIVQIGDGPDFFTVCPLPDVTLEAFFGTTEPTHEMLEDEIRFYEDMERGQGIYVIVYKDRRPDEYFFAGYSFD